MTTYGEQPCREHLTKACFKKDPAFAKRAFAIRLLFLFVPPYLSKKFFAFLGYLYNWVDIYPWFIPYPTYPKWPGWNPDDPGTPFPGPYPRYPINPFLPGPPRSPPGGEPPLPVWFFSTCSSILPVWETYINGSAQILVIENTKFWFDSTGTDNCLVRTAANTTIPDKWIFKIMLKISLFVAGDPNLFIQIFSGSHAVKLRFNPPTTIWHATGGGSEELTVPIYTGVWHEYELHYDDGYTDLYQGGVLLHSGQHHQHSNSTPGRISINNDNYLRSEVDYVTILDNT